MNLYHDLQHFLGWISAYRILGFIPLGMPLHIGISALITILLLKRGMKLNQVFILVFMIGLSKEILDSFVINNTMKKHILDMCYDMSFPTLLVMLEATKAKIHKIKSRDGSDD